MRAILFILVLFMAFSVSGCKTLNQFINPNGEDVSLKGEEFNLDNDQAYLLRTWYHNAVLSEDVGDYNAAIMYYSKIVEYFPETKKAAMAKKRLNVLNKAH
ncbi:MAG: hypothetical protein KKD05_10910 [Candidatus Omnitrophica bacterium]|nr:hypothetical protein [Candidatus Omnitrophota bacterium]